MNGVSWLPAEDRALRTLFPHMQTRDVARIMGRSVSAISGRAAMKGIRKSVAFNASPLSGRNIKGHAPNGMKSRFQKGRPSWNKGMKGLNTGGEAGWFKKGHFPANRDPDFYVLGALRVNADGYIDMRISFDKGAKGWRALHRILWEDTHGPVPHGHALVFKDGDRLNVCLENLQLITRAELARRNSIHTRLPKPLVHTIMVLGQLKRRIREAHDRRAAD